MKELFGTVDNLEMFIHPKFNESFRFMNNRESIALAKEIYHRFVNSRQENIIVIESGTSPLIAIIKRLKEYKRNPLNITQIKIPRDLNFNLLGWFKVYLSHEELNEVIEYKGIKIKRYEALKKLCKDFNLEEYIGNDKFTIYDSIKNNKSYNTSTKDFNLVLKGTKLSKIFSQEFLLFDEYINAGTIIRNFNGLVRLFNSKPKFKLSAFCMFLDHPENYKNIEFTLYNNQNELECYRKGAYPFENRIDLIGYYYFISDNEFKKVFLEELKKDVESKQSSKSIEKLYTKLNKIIIENNLLESLKESLEEEQVRKYVTNKDIIRFIFKDIDEYLYGKNKYADFLDQLFELYAPSWSPMPTIYHLDYWNGFSRIKNKLEKNYPEIKEDYIKNRFAIINLALESLKENKNVWEASILKEMEE